MIYTFNDEKATQTTAVGGKAAALAQLYQQGYPVPLGFVISAATFHENGLPEDVWTAVLDQVKALRNGSNNMRFAVRSSALNEDSAQASFAGEYETVLNVMSDEEIRQAVQTVYNSQFSQRVAAYRKAITQESAIYNQQTSIAVIVQKMVPADLAGVLFTANPVTGSHDYMVGNYVHGLGEQLVSGEANAETFTLDRPSGKYEGPLELKPAAKKLFKYADKLAEQLKNPQDIEWAVANGDLYLLQSRPITTMKGYNAATGVYNDSLQGDFLWTNSNLGEAFPDVMTPMTWSLVQIFAQESNPLSLPGSHPMMGNIGGRIYMNMSLIYSMLRSIDFSRERINKESEEFFGHLPENVTIPTIPVSRWQFLRQNAAQLLKIPQSRRKLMAELPGFSAKNAERTAEFHQEIQAAAKGSELAMLWRDTLEPYFRHACRLLQAGTSRYENAYRPLHRTLQKQAGETEAITLLSGVGKGSDQLASLGPLVGLWQVANGEMSRESYAHQFGHRGPHEMETAIANPDEDPAWIDDQLHTLGGVDVPALLAAQQAKKEAAWTKYVQQHPKDTAKIQPKLEEAAKFARGREAIRSEFTRLFALMRVFVLRAGELTGLGEDAFFLSIEELVDVLEGGEITAVSTGSRQAISEIPPRRDAYETLRELPPYPAIINGRFDPVAWAADPNRRSDIYDSHHNETTSPRAADETVITGFPGSPGIVEGVVRLLYNLGESNELQPGEILVTTTTNVGWTPIFPKATAVITDVGAPLSHAAIVARELGIPAVVGCGDATMRLKTGDRVSVDGGQGIITILNMDQIE